jgi:hypothetical protein
VLLNYKKCKGELIMKKITLKISISLLLIVTLFFPVSLAQALTESSEPTYYCPVHNVQMVHYELLGHEEREGIHDHFIGYDDDYMPIIVQNCYYYETYDYWRYRCPNCPTYNTGTEVYKYHSL